MELSQTERDDCDFDSAIYAQSLPKIGNNSDCEIENNKDSLHAHWIKLGLDRQILASTIDCRSSFLNLINTSENSLLEIGPFFSPAFTDSQARIKYADILSTDQLIERAHALGAATEGVPTIDFVSQEGKIDTNGMKFDVVFSSHVAEHQPNLIGHLLNVLDILVDQGKYYFIVPDHRSCFDCFMTPSSLAEVLAAYYEERVRPTLKSVLEHRLFTVDFSKIPRTNPFDHLVSHAFHGLPAAVHEFNTHDYVDVHCWYFTPKSLKVMLSNCIHLGLLPCYLNISVFPLGPDIGCILEKNSAG